MSNAIHPSNADLHPFAPTIHDMAGRYDGVLVADLGEHTELVLAVTGDKAEALAAINSYHGEICGSHTWPTIPQLTEAEAFPCMETRTVLFLKAPPEEADGWTWMTVPAGDSPHGIQVTYLHQYPIPSCDGDSPLALPPTREAMTVTFDEGEAA